MPDPSVERFRRVVQAAYAYLDARRNEVNDLNVFPVADGDTGDNMALTMRAVLAELDRIESEAEGEADRIELVHAVARAALMGARGNSGVILSQIVRGAAEELATRPGDLIDPVLVASAFARAADAAYDSVRNPAEGTMLTVMRAMAAAAAKHLARLSDDDRRLAPEDDEQRQEQVLAEVLEVVTQAGEEAVRRTPGQLPVLAEAGVVDAGGHGLVLILAGALAGLRAADGPEGIEIPAREPARISAPQHTDSRYRYCVNFIVQGEGLDGETFEAPLREIGDSVLVVGDRRTLRVHVHTDEPRAAREVFDGVGEISRVDEADMREQVAERDRRLGGPDVEVSVVAVVSGAGLRDLYEGLGATVVDGGATMNPSTDEILAAIHAADGAGVLVLPNNKNVVMAAEHAARLSAREARVLDCTAPQAGLAALVELDPSASLSENVARLEAALESITVGAIAPAARDDAQGRFVRGDAVGFVDGELVAWGGAGSTLAETLDALAGEAIEILTIVEGDGAPIQLDEVAALAPESAEVEVHRGGQPSYWWLLAAQ